MISHNFFLIEFLETPQELEKPYDTTSPALSKLHHVVPSTYLVCQLLLFVILSFSILVLIEISF